MSSVSTDRYLGIRLVLHARTDATHEMHKPTLVNVLHKRFASFCSEADPDACSKLLQPAQDQSE